MWTIAEPGTGARISAAEHALKSAEVNNDLPLAAALRLHLGSYQAGEPSSAPLPTPTLSP